ncbi:phosphotransferase [Paenibacillus wynnii]|uniref:phosphotransferase n=1 Tax=Paenibacillus wynnii TaxID=268407 RepID=UPI002792B559|nr:phosphotransferase [Paenibacillus wynnii]MDQ0193267.1 thiamine kinase-like enzyme [Paenibacillus wynnii]
MPLNNNKLMNIFKGNDISESLCIRRIDHITRDRATINKIEIHRKDNEFVPLIEKNTISSSCPHENIVYKYFSNKDVSIPKVYYNEYDQYRQEGILLIEDLSPTHRNISDWEVPIELNKLINLIDVISQFHAVSWGNVDLSAPKHLESVEEYIQHIAYLERDYFHFRKHQTFNFEEEHFQIYEKSLIYLRKNAQQHIERITNNHNTTFIHGDLNVCNLLYPSTRNARPYIIDLEAVRVGLCTEDLVMLFIHDLFHGGEETLRIFQLYYTAISHKISCQYSYNQFIEDIRLSIMEGIFFPIKLFVHNGIKDEELVMKSINAYKTFWG